MASNPMQRKARNSFLLGMVITLLISAVIIGFVFMQLIQKEKELKNIQNSYMDVSVLTRDVKSGEEITLSDFKKVKALKQSAPSNGTTIALGEKNTAKIDLKAGTILTEEMLNIDKEAIANDIRIEEYNIISLPIDLVTDDYADIRLMLPTGQNYIVVSKKQITVPVVDGMYSADTIHMELSEDEILAMSSAIVESYIIPGSKLYATKYTEPGIQEAAEPTYIPRREVTSLISSNRNIVDEAKRALAERYNQYMELRNNYINALIEDKDEETAVESGLAESVTKTQQERKSYLESLIP